MPTMTDHEDDQELRIRPDGVVTEGEPARTT